MILNVNGTKVILTDTEGLDLTYIRFNWRQFVQNIICEKLKHMATQGATPSSCTFSATKLLEKSPCREIEAHITGLKELTPEIVRLVHDQVDRMYRFGEDPWKEPLVFDGPTLLASRKASPRTGQFTCPIPTCGKIYKVETSFVKHVNGHTTVLDDNSLLLDTKYRCGMQGCESKYPCPQSLKHHIWTQHVPDEDRKKHGVHKADGITRYPTLSHIFSTFRSTHHPNGTISYQI